MSEGDYKIRFNMPLANVRLGAGKHKADDEKGCSEAERRRMESLERRAAEIERRESELAKRWAQLEERERQAEHLCERFRELLESVRTAKADMLQEHEETIVAFTLKIARKVLQHEVDNGHYKIGEIVRSALDTVRNESEVVVRVHPEDQELASRALAEGARPYPKRVRN